MKTSTTMTAIKIEHDSPDESDSDEDDGDFSAEEKAIALREQAENDGTEETKDQNNEAGGK